MLGALFREYIAVFLEIRRESNRFLLINKFLDLGGLYYGPLFLYFIYRDNITYISRGILLD